LFPSLAADEGKFRAFCECDPCQSFRHGDVNALSSALGAHWPALADTLVVLPHEICPVDTTVIEGQGSMNEAYLTGEPFEVEKAPDATVLSGSLNGEAVLIIRAERLATDSRYARIMRVMEETSSAAPNSADSETFSEPGTHPWPSVLPFSHGF
jgi:hypothetical protein